MLAPIFLKLPLNINQNHTSALTYQDVVKYVFKGDMRLLLYNLFAAHFHINSIIAYSMTDFSQHVDVPYSFSI